MEVTIQPGKLKGTITVPPSKSAAHRGLICAALARGTSVITTMGTSEDIKASVACVEALGAKCSVYATTITITGIDTATRECVLHCNESGSTLRFFTPIAAVLGVKASFRGKGKLGERPMEPLLSQLKIHGITVEKKKNELFSISGKLTSGIYKISGNISSQFVTGLLLALPILSGNSEIILTTPLDSKGYVDLTVETMKTFGVKVLKTDTGYKIPGNQAYQPQKITIEGDFSAASFWFSAMCMGHKIRLKGLSLDSLQPDREILAVLKGFGGIFHVKMTSYG